MRDPRPSAQTVSDICVKGSLSITALHKSIPTYLLIFYLLTYLLYYYRHSYYYCATHMHRPVIVSGVSPGGKESLPCERFVKHVGFKPGVKERGSHG